MKHMFLTSAALSVAHDIPRHIDLTLGNNLVFIDTAAEPEKNGDTTWLTNDRQALVDAGFSLSDYTITGKSIHDLEKDLSGFDFIYCSGGSTAHLLTESYTSGFITLVQKLVTKMGKVYIGTSAGSIITGPRIPPYYKDEQYPNVTNKSAFNLVDFTVIPHWGSDDFRDLYITQRIEDIYREDQPPFLLLADHQYIEVQDDYITIRNLRHW